MREYRRLSGSSIGLRNGSPIEQMIDVACERPAIDNGEAHAFFEFVREFLWSRLPLTEGASNPRH
jgi:hypothetical protein